MDRFSWNWNLLGPRKPCTWTLPGEGQVQPCNSFTFDPKARVQWNQDHWLFITLGKVINVGTGGRSERSGLPMVGVSLCPHSAHFSPPWHQAWAPATPLPPVPTA